MNVSLLEKYRTNNVTKAQNHALGHNSNEKSQNHNLPQLVTSFGKQYSAYFICTKHQNLEFLDI